MEVEGTCPVVGSEQRMAEETGKVAESEQSVVEKRCGVAAESEQGVAEKTYEGREQGVGEKDVAGSEVLMQGVVERTCEEAGREEGMAEKAYEGSEQGAEEAYDVEGGEVQTYDVEGGEMQTYDVTGSEVHTPYNLQLQLEMKAESVEFQGVASGRLMHSGARPLQNAKLLTDDLHRLVSRCTLFSFQAFGPSKFEVQFLDPNKNTLGVLEADPLPPLDQPSPCIATGVGTWSRTF